MPSFTRIFSQAFLQSFFIPCRSIKTSKFVYPWMNRRKPYWVDQKADPRLDKELSFENSQFLLEERRILTTSSPLVFSPKVNTSWIPFETQRCGLVGIKLGIYPLWTKSGERINCTIIQIPDNHVIRYVPPNEVGNYLSLRDPRGYWISNKTLPSWITNQRWGLQMVGCMSADPLEFTPAWCGLFTKAGVAPKRKISRFLVSPDAALEPGTPLFVHHFRVGDYVDVISRTINRGFQGGIERWGMSGGPAGHGSTKFHRRVGSLAGAGRKVVRGKRMAGVMGNRYRSVRGLQILRINPRLNLIYLSGPTAGPVHSFCHLCDSWLINHQHEILKDPPPTPTWFSCDSLDDDSEAFLPENGSGLFDDFKDDIYHESIHRYDEPSIISPTKF